MPERPAPAKRGTLLLKADKEAAEMARRGPMEIIDDVLVVEVASTGGVVGALLVVVVEATILGMEVEVEVVVVVGVVLRPYRSRKVRARSRPSSIHFSGVKCARRPPFDDVEKALDDDEDNRFAPVALAAKEL